MKTKLTILLLFICSIAFGQTKTDTLTLKTDKGFISEFRYSTTKDTLFFNGDTLLLSGGGMTYPDAGIALSTGSAWGISITNNSANWNTAYTDRLKWDGGATDLVAATGRTSLNVDVAGTDNSTDVTLAGAPYLSLSTQQITAATIDTLATHISSSNWETYISNHSAGGGDADFNNGGDVAGAARIIGNTDAYDFGIMTNNKVNWNFTSAGKCRIGTETASDYTMVVSPHNGNSLAEFGGKSYSTGSLMRLMRINASSVTDSPVADIIQESASDDQDALRVRNDGTGASLRVLQGTSEIFTTIGMNIGIGTNTFGTSSSLVLSIANGTAPTTNIANQINIYSLSGELYVMDDAGNQTLLSPHASDAPEWMYDVDDPMPPQIDKETNSFDGIVRYTNNTRKNKLIELQLNGEILPIGNARKFIFTETYKEHNERTGNSLVIDDWDKYQERELQRSLKNIEKHNKDKADFNKRKLYYENSKDKDKGVFLETFDKKKPNRYIKKIRKK